MLDVSLHDNPSIARGALAATMKRKGRVCRDKQEKLEKVLFGGDKFSERHPHRVGANLFSSAKWFKLTKQVRAVDAKQIALVEKMANGKVPSKEEIDELQELSKEDLEKPDWLMAPMIVSTNHERAIMTHCRAIDYATYHGQIVIRWPMKFKGHSERFVNEDSPDDPAFCECFVGGAEGFFCLTVNKELELVNARKMTFHSLIASNEVDEQRIMQAIAKGPGEVATLDDIPIAINVSFAQTTLEEMSARTRRALEKLSVSRTAIVVPLAIASGNDFYKTLNLRDPLNVTHRVEAAQSFPVELGFAVTVHKSEGGTLKKNIVALSQRFACNFTFEGFHCRRVSGDKRSWD